MPLNPVVRASGAGEVDRFLKKSACTALPLVCDCRNAPVLRLDTLFRISPSSGVPIYRQIIDQVRILITSGRWPEGVMLSAVRQIAEKMETNLIPFSRPTAASKPKGSVSIDARVDAELHTTRRKRRTIRWERPLGGVLTNKCGSWLDCTPVPLLSRSGDRRGVGTLGDRGRRAPNTPVVVHGWRSRQTQRLRRDGQGDCAATEKMAS
jgi:hypothetical protein